MKKICAFLIIITLISISCSSKEKAKPSADSLMTMSAIDSIYSIKTAYQEKNSDILRSRMEPVIAENILKKLSFEKAELSFTTKMVKIFTSTIEVNLNWQGTWTVKGKTLKNRGVGVLVLQKETMKLTQIDGDNPFIIPSVKE